MHLVTPFGAFTLPSGLSSRLGRLRASRIQGQRQRTRYTTLATQSVLRTHAFSRSKNGSSSSYKGLLLLNLSMLSLLPLLFDSMHGQSAYGYPSRSASSSASASASSASTSDKKGKGRDMSTSAPHHAPEATAVQVSSSDASMHYPDYPASSSSSSSSSHLEHQPPMIGLSSSRASRSMEHMQQERVRFREPNAGIQKVASLPSVSASKPSPSSPPVQADQSQAPVSSRSTQAASTPSTSYNALQSASESLESDEANRQYTSPRDPEMLRARQERRLRKIHNNLVREQKLASRTEEQKLRTRVSRKIWQLMSHPHPSYLNEEAKELDLTSEITLGQLREFPVIQACGLVKEMMQVDRKAGFTPLHTVRSRTINTLLWILSEGETPESGEASYMDNAVAAARSAALERFGLRAATRELYGILENIEAVDSKGVSLSCSAKEAYLRILAQEIFNIVDSLNDAARQESPEASNDVAAATAPQANIDHLLCTKLALAHQNAFYFASAVSLHAASWKDDHKSADGRALAADIESTMKDSILPRLIGVLQRPAEHTGAVYEKTLRAMEDLSTILKSQSMHPLRSSLIFHLMHLPVPPAPAQPQQKLREPTGDDYGSEDKGSDMSCTATGEVPESSIRFEAARIRHAELFKSVHACLVGFVQALVNLPPPKPSPRGGWKYHSIKFTKSQWQYVKAAIPSPSALKAERKSARSLANDSDSLVEMLRYAYRHLQSSSIATKLYDVYVTCNLVTEGDMQRLDAIRIRSETLLQRNAFVKTILSSTFPALAKLSGLVQYQPLPRPNTLTFEEDARLVEIEKRRNALWTVDVLLRCPDLDMSLLSAILAYWTSTSQVYQLRCFMHHFFTMHRQVELSQSPGNNTPHTTTVGMQTIADTGLSLFEPTMPIPQAATIIERMLHDPEILVVLMNAAATMGNTSLAEKCWLVACQIEESRSDWKLPVAAYTIMLQVYEAEASREAALTRRRQRAAGLLSGNAERNVYEGGVAMSHSRITFKERAEANLAHKQVCIGFATAVYYRFAEKATIDEADPHFFKAALSAFGKRSSEYRQALKAVRPIMKPTSQEYSKSTVAGEPSSDDGSEATDSGFGSSDGGSDDFRPSDPETSNMLHIVVADSRKAGLIVPQWAEAMVPSGTEGILKYSPQPAVSSTQALSRSRSPLVQWIKGNIPGSLAGRINYDTVTERGFGKARRSGAVQR